MTHFVKKYGPWALVTGASGGIGEEFARQLSAQDLNLVLVARRGAVLNQLAKELRKTHGIEIKTIEQDLATENGAVAVIDAIDGLEIGLLINNAGVVFPGAFVWQDQAAVESLLAVNMRAPTLLAHYFGQKMVARGRGGILLIASTFAYQAVPYFQQYAATKAYILALGEAMYFEMKPLGVDVTVLSPGPTKTPMLQMEGMDFSKIPIPAMAVVPVVRVGLKALGQKPSVIPGGINRFMAFMGRYLAWRSMLTGSFGKLVRRGLDPTRLSIRALNTSHRSDIGKDGRGRNRTVLEK